MAPYAAHASESRSAFPSTVWGCLLLFVRGIAILAQGALHEKTELATDAFPHGQICRDVGAHGADQLPCDVPRPQAGWSRSARSRTRHLHRGSVRRRPQFPARRRRSPFRPRASVSACSRRRALDLRPRVAARPRGGRRALRLRGPRRQGTAGIAPSSLPGWAFAAGLARDAGDGAAPLAVRDYY